VRAENGKIYAFPYSAKQILEVDPTGNEVITTHIGTSSGSTNRKYATSVVAENGKIFAAPLDADYVLDIDSTENEFTATHIGTNLSSSDSTSKYRRYNIHYNGKYRTSAVAGNGKIYAAPYTARKVLDINPRRNEVFTRQTCRHRPWSA